MESATSRLSRQLADAEFVRSTLERQNSTLDSELSASRHEVAGLKSTVAQMSAAQAGIEAELSVTKVIKSLFHCCTIRVSLVLKTGVD